MTDQNEQWEKKLITQLAQSSFEEQKKARKWGIFFKLFTVAYLVLVPLLFIYSASQDSGHTADTHTALVDVVGIIADGQPSSADNIVSALRNAFEDEKTAGVILRVNSPGGTPVQAGYIYDEIIRLREKYPEIPMYTVISDICASGGYYIASAADKIYANKASIVGSIGVRMDNFGFVEAMQKLGIERRTLTAGENKALLDPFAPVDQAVNAHLQSMLAEIHQQFIDAVKKGRGDRLKNTDKLFTGLIWTGERSIEIGLVDELASSAYVAREVIGAENIVNFTLEENLFERLANRIGSSMASTLSNQFFMPYMR